MKPDLTKISPLPWTVDGFMGGTVYSGDPDEEKRVACNCCLRENDAAYIVHAANNLPKLLAALKAIAEYKFDCECVVPSQMATIALEALKAAGEL